MTAWTPADGPSREAIPNIVRNATRFALEEWVIQVALAAHDLYEENQRLKVANERLRRTWEVEADAHAANVAELKAKPAGQALDEIREVIQLRGENQRLRALLKVERKEAAKMAVADTEAEIAKLRSDLAEAKRDTARLDWVRNHYCSFSSSWQGGWPMGEEDHTVRWTEFVDQPEYHAEPRVTTVHGTNFRCSIDEAMRLDSRYQSNLLGNGDTPPTPETKDGS